MENPTENDRKPDERAGCAVAEGSAFVISARALHWATEYREACLAADIAGAHYPKLQDFIQRALNEQEIERAPIAREEVDAYLGAHSIQHSMQSNSSQHPQAVERPALVSGDLLGVPYLVDNLREWAAEFRANQHPATLTLFRAIQTLEKLEREVTAHKCGERDKQLTIEWQERQLADLRRVIALVAKHADFSQCPPDVEEEVDRVNRGEGGPAS